MPRKCSRFSAQEEGGAHHRKAESAGGEGALLIHQVNDRFQRAAEIGLCNGRIGSPFIHGLLVAPDRRNRTFLRVFKHIGADVGGKADVLAEFRIAKEVPERVGDHLRRAGGIEIIQSEVVGVAGLGTEDAVGILQCDQPCAGAPCGAEFFGPSHVVTEGAVAGPGDRSSPP